MTMVDYQIQLEMGDDDHVRLITPYTINIILSIKLSVISYSLIQIIFTSQYHAHLDPCTEVPVCKSFTLPR